MSNEFIIENQVASTSLLNDKLTDLKNIQQSSAKKTELTDTEKAEYAKASRGFESIFMNMMLKEMKTGMLDKDNEEQNDYGFGSDILDGYSNTLLADEISKSGSGIGIAEMLYSHLTGGDKLKPITYEIPSQPVKSNTPAPLKSVGTGIHPSSEPISGNFIDKLNYRLTDYKGIIESASQKFDVPQSLIKAIISAESAGRADARSTAGAKGLMQLMDGTADNLGVNNSFNPNENIMGGTKYIKMMLDRFDGNIDLALAAYNAGPGNVEKFRGVPPFKETQSYVQKVKKYNEIFGKISNIEA